RGGEGGRLGRLHRPDGTRVNDFTALVEAAGVSRLGVWSDRGTATRTTLLPSCSTLASRALCRPGPRSRFVLLGGWAERRFPRPSSDEPHGRRAACRLTLRPSDAVLATRARQV